MKKFIINVSDLVSSGRKIAKLKSNRVIKNASVKAKKKSMKQYGQLVPAIYVEATLAVQQGLEIVDFLTGEEISEDDIQLYVVIIDGQHRLKAHFELLAEKPIGDDQPYKEDFYLLESLNPTASVTKQLSEVNSVTTPWKGSDYCRCAKMLIQDQELPVLDFVTELTDGGMSLAAASIWATGGDKVSQTCLISAIGGAESGRIPEVLTKKDFLEHGKSMHAAAKEVFRSPFMAVRNLPTWLAAAYQNRDDSKEGFVNKMKAFFGTLKGPVAEDIETITGTRGGDTKEALINRKLNSLYAEFLKKNKNEQ